MNKLIKQAFTLIELLVVIAIIGILSGLIVVSMNGMTTKANLAKAQVFSNSLRNSLLGNISNEWKFDENAGTTTTDSWSGNVGTLMGSTAWRTSSNCVYGSCVLLNGTTDYISHTAVIFADSIPHTFSVWLKWGTTIPSDYIIPFGYGGLNTQNIYFTQGTSKVFLYRANGQGGTSITNSNSSSVFDGNWHNVVWTIDSSRVARFYIDGKQSGNNTTIANSTEISYRYIGYGYTGSAYMWNGYVDELRIFNATMPAYRIKEQYYVGLNSLLANGSISKSEYFNKINETAQK